MNVAIELILDTGEREPVDGFDCPDRDQLLPMLMTRLRGARDRPEVVGAWAAYEGGGLRVDRLRPPEKAEAGA